MENANHLILFDHECRGRRDGSRRADPKRLAGQASFAKKIAGPENRHDGFFAGFIDDGKLHAALLNVQDILTGIALREDRFPFS